MRALGKARDRFTAGFAGESGFNFRVLEKYFAEGAYRFQMQFGRGALADFYASGEEDTALLQERAKWLGSAPKNCLVFLPEGEPLLNEALKLAGLSGDGDYEEKARRLGLHWEPDYLLLTRHGGETRLVCACVCFPSSWAVEEKIGRPIEDIHSVVPGLNAAIGRQIGTFLERLKPGLSWTRSNWGLSRSPDLNQHPQRGLPRLDETVTAGEVFWRLEEQSLTALPETGGILFGIRIKVVPLKDFFGIEAGLSLKRSLETMPDALAEYKGLARARRRIIALLEGAV